MTASEPLIRICQPSDESRPVVRLFLAYSNQEDRDLVRSFREELNVVLKPSPKWQFIEFIDANTLVGEYWEDRILSELNRCDLGILLLSPAFFGSEFITNRELPVLAKKRLIPVLLKLVDWENTNTRGIEKRQVFRANPWETPQVYPAHASTKRHTWMVALGHSIHSVLDKYAQLVPGASDRDDLRSSLS